MDNWESFHVVTKASLVLLNSDQPQMNSGYPGTSPAASQISHPALQHPQTPTQHAWMEDWWRYDAENIPQTPPVNTSSSANIYHPQTLQPTQGSAYQSNQQNPLFEEYYHPSYPPKPLYVPHPHVMHHFSHPWPVYYNPFCYMSSPVMNFNHPFQPSFTTLVPCMNPACSWQVLHPCVSVYHVKKNSGKKQNLSERAPQVMETLGSKVSDRAEVTAGGEEDMCALYLKHSDIMNEANLDMDYINYLLSSEQHVSDVSPNEFSSITPESVAGCSVSEAQIQCSSALQPFPGTDLHVPQDQIPTLHQSTAAALEPFQENTELQTLPQLLLADDSVQDRLTPTEFNLETVAAFTETVPHPPADGGLEFDGDKSIQEKKKCKRRKHQKKTADDQDERPGKTRRKAKKHGGRAQKTRRIIVKIPQIQKRTDVNVDDGQRAENQVREFKTRHRSCKRTLRAGNSY